MFCPVVGYRLSLDVPSLSYFRGSVMSDLFATPWTVDHQAPLSMGFPRQEYRSGLPFPSPGALPNPGNELMSLVSPALAGGFFAP